MCIRDSGNNAPFLPTNRIVAYGRGGNDTFQQNSGLGTLRAEFHGEAGNDAMVGAAGDDVLVGGAGHDMLQGLGGNDILWGDQVALTFADRSGDGTLTSTDGNDRLEGGDGNDGLFGAGGHDVLIGMVGSDYIHGGFGNDQLTGSEGNDILRGEDGDDIINGSEGDDLLFGGVGNDMLYGETGMDFLLAGIGSDRLYDTNDDLADVMISEGNSTYDADLISINGFNPTNPLTFLSQNDLALQTILGNWVAANGNFATQVAIARAAFVSGTSTDSVADYIYGNIRVADYSLAVTGAYYNAIAGDTVDPV